jgi:hypothetical protein
MFGYNVRDTLLKQTVALPATATNAVLAAFDLGELSTRDDFVAQCELLITAPALTTTQLPDASTATYSVEMSTDNFVTNTVIVADKVLVQTGAGGAGAAAATARFRLPTQVSRYARVKVTLAGSPGTCVAATLTGELLF